MALVFKIKFQDTLRRWVVTDRFIKAGNLPSLQQLEAKIQELFQLPSTTAFVITYIDKEEDVVTLAGDQDLVDACIGQGLNPLRLDVKSPKESEIREASPNASASSPSVESPLNLNVETFLKGIFPQATADVINQFLSKLPQVDPKLPAALMLRNAQEAFNEFLKTLTRDSMCAKRWAGRTSSENAYLNPYEHPHAHQPDPKRFPWAGRTSSENAYPNPYEHPHADRFDPKRFPWAGRSSENAYPNPYEHPHADQSDPNRFPWAGRTTSENESRNPYESPHCDRSELRRFLSEGTGAFTSAHRCDGCGKNPIEGPRFKSKKVYDYDLCSSCFETMGNEIDYEKIDRPVHPPHYGFLNNSHLGRWGWQHMGPPPFRPQHMGAPPFGPQHMGPPPFGRPQHMGPPPFGPQHMGPPPFGPWSAHVPCTLPEYIPAPGGAWDRKLDARFVKDVTIFDGTELAPSTKFTKIWRLSNVGTIPWPQNTQLVHIGGDMLVSEKVVNLELPEGGLPCGEEVEASADLVAPVKAGRYVSQWRLASPSGQKFGHRVWAVIQVVPQGEQSPQLHESIRGEESTQEVEQAEMSTEKGNEEYTSGLKGKEKLVSLQHREAMIPDTVVLDSGKRVDVEIAENANKEELSIKVPDQINNMDNSTTDQAYVTDHSAKLNGLKGTVNSDELDGFSVVEKPVENTEWEDVTESKTDHEKHLQLLERMGYTDREFNVELLQKNNQNLELTVEDLVATAGWDDMLNDLQEMGFFDRQINRWLLRKNQGSIKRVVKDLVEMEKQKVGQNRKDAGAREANKV